MNVLRIRFLNDNDNNYGTHNLLQQAATGKTVKSQNDFAFTFVVQMGEDSTSRNSILISLLIVSVGTVAL